MKWFKVHLTELFYLLDQIFMLCLMKIIKEIPINFSSINLRCIKCGISDGIQYRARWEIGNSIAVTLKQDCYCHGFSIPQLFCHKHSTLSKIHITYIHTLFVPNGLFRIKR